MADKTPVPASEVRAWLRSRGHAVGSRGHLPERLIAEFNHRHHKKKFESTNPWRKGAKKGSSEHTP